MEHYYSKLLEFSRSCLRATCQCSVSVLLICNELFDQEQLCTTEDYITLYQLTLRIEIEIGVSQTDRLRDVSCILLLRDIVEVTWMRIWPIQRLTVASRWRSQFYAF